MMKYQPKCTLHYVCCHGSLCHGMNVCHDIKFKYKIKKMFIVRTNSEEDICLEERKTIFCFCFIGVYLIVMNVLLNITS